MKGGSIMESKNFLFFGERDEREILQKQKTPAYKTKYSIEGGGPSEVQNKTRCHLLFAPLPCPTSGSDSEPRSDWRYCVPNNEGKLFSTCTSNFGINTFLYTTKEKKKKKK